MTDATTSTGTDPATASAPRRPSTRAGRLAVIIALLAGLLITNLAVYAIGRALGGAFTYTQKGTTTRVDPIAITFMSLVPLGVGLALVAALARRWSATILVARVAAPILAVVTIAVMTLPAGFDTTSAVSLAAMHLATIPAALLALNTLSRRPDRDTPSIESAN